MSRNTLRLTFSLLTEGRNLRSSAMSSGARAGAG